MACSTPVASSNSSPNPTEFVATRVAQLLTESALTSATPVLPAATEALTPLPPTLALPTAGATITLPELSAPSGTPAVPGTVCADACVQPAEHFWLERPIPADYVDDVERTYAYGSTQGGQREPHHGVEFVNPADTPVIAAAPGTVIVAGNDSIIAYGPAPKFYGNLVVVKLDQAYDGQPVFNLYGHLKSVAAKVGQPVN
ncbi:MAG: peptidoglycan DD-metalloendopeptidase family protein, partial [Anaerolineales bacterium]